MPRLPYSVPALAALAAVLALGQTPTAPAGEQGIASWYGGRFDGQRAASGEIFHEAELTAAHPTLAFGTKVRVRRLDSGQSVVVRITDRGPFVGSRIIDLSSAAARGLGMLDPGLVAVALEVVEAPAASHSVRFGVQAGTFRDPENARRSLALMQREFGGARMAPAHGSVDLYAILVGESTRREAALALAEKVKSLGKAYSSAFVVRLNSQPGFAQTGEVETPERLHP